jgi:uncharacterized protein YkwD
MISAAPARRRIRRRGAMVALAAGALALILSSCSPQEDEMFGYMNSARRSAGIGQLENNLTLYMKASSWSSYMAKNCPTLCHSNLAANNGYAWRLLGENVGRGPTISGLHNAFMNSSPHRANILNYRFQYASVGVYRDGSGMYWVTEEFMQL